MDVILHGLALAALRQTGKRGAIATYSQPSLRIVLIRAGTSQRHHDLAEMPVGFHVLERLADVVEAKHLVDRQPEPAALDGAPDILFNFVKNLADFVDGAGAEGDADIADAARGMQVKVEFGTGAAEPADIDDAALDLAGGQILGCELAGDLID